LFIGVALLLIIGVLSRGRAIAIIGALIAYLVLSPFAGVVLAMFPWWVSLLLLVVFVMSVLRAASCLLFGECASDVMVGTLAADVVRGAFKALLFPFRLVARLARSH
jgi:hypothetical protein